MKQHTTTEYFLRVDGVDYPAKEVLQIKHISSSFQLWVDAANSCIFYIIIEFSGVTTMLQLRYGLSHATLTYMDSDKLKHMFQLSPLI